MTAFKSQNSDNNSSALMHSVATEELTAVKCQLLLVQYLHFDVIEPPILSTKLFDIADERTSFYSFHVLSIVEKKTAYDT